MADFLNGVFISEILADNAGGSAVDTDGDGNTNKADEFIEFGNASGTPVSLDGHEVWSETNGLLYAFGPGDTLAPGDTATVVGNYTGTPPAGFYSAGLAENGNFIPDGEGQKFDTIFLVDTNTGDYIALSYGNPPRTPTLPNGFTGTTQVGTGEAIDSNAPNGTAFARDSSGTLVETSPTPGTPDVACFVAGTRILTRRGEVSVEDLRPGDMVPTYDHGAQRLIGICAQHLPAATLLRHPALRPLTVDGASFDRPDPINLSPAHCLLHHSARAQLYFSDPQVLIRARHFETAGHARSYLPRGGVTYYHLLFAAHELVLANGYWSETFLNAPAAKRDIVPGAWDLTTGTLATWQHTMPARMILRGFEARALLRPRAARTTSETPRKSSQMRDFSPAQAPHQQRAAG